MLDLLFDLISYARPAN